MTERRSDPRAYPPRGLDREEAARYVGVGTTKFDDWVERRIMPRPKRQDGKVLWDRFALDAAFTDLPEESVNGIDQVLQGGRSAA